PVRTCVSEPDAPFRAVALRISSKHVGRVTEETGVELENKLWTKDAKSKLYGGDAAAHQAAILEQYKIYVEMADRSSQRRGLTNTFFLTLNTAIFTGIAAFWQHKPAGEVWLLAFLLAMLLGECFAWFYLLRSYRSLNAAKYQVVGALETQLPASPYWRAE